MTFKSSRYKKRLDNNFILYNNESISLKELVLLFKELKKKKTDLERNEGGNNPTSMTGFNIFSWKRNCQKILIFLYQCL